MEDKKLNAEIDGKSYIGFTKSELIQSGVHIDKANRAEFDFLISDTRSKRLNAYSLESDPLYMEWKYDNTPESEQKWRGKVEEIKQRYPLPVYSDE